MPMTTPGKFDSNGAWDGFRGEIWQEEINVRDFIQKNYTPYDGDEAFLTDPTDRTQKLWNHVQKLQKEEREKGGVLECETEVVSGLTAYGAGYISEDMKELEQIVGLQTDKPLKRAFMPYGGIRMAVQAAETYGYEINPELKKIFTTYVTTHNDAVLVPILLRCVLPEKHMLLQVCRILMAVDVLLVTTVVLPFMESTALLRRKKWLITGLAAETCMMM